MFELPSYGFSGFCIFQLFAGHGTVTAHPGRKTLQPDDHYTQLLSTEGNQEEPNSIQAP